MKYKMESGVYNLDFELSLLEKKLFREFEDMLDSKGFKYLSIQDGIALKGKGLKILLNLYQ